MAIEKNPHIIEMQSRHNYDYCVFPGGYPLYYITADGGVLCAKCANDNYELTLNADDPQWYIVDVDVRWEDNYAPVYCDNCNARIQPACGDD